MEILIFIGVIIGISLVVATIVWPQIGVGTQLVGVLFALIAISHLGFQSGILYSIFGLMLLGGLSFILRRKVSLFRFTPQELLIFALLLWMIISLQSTPTPNYGMNKLLRFIGICLPLTILCRIFGSTPEYMKQTLRVLGWMSLPVLLFYILLFLTARGSLTVQDRFSGGTNDLMAGYTAATAIALTFYLILSDSRLWLKCTAILVVFAGMVVIGATGSRGPFLGLIGGAALSFLGRKAALRSALILGLIAIVTVVSLAYLVPDTARERVLSGFRSESLENSGRTSLYRLGIQQYTNYPLKGEGLGSFAYYRGWGETQTYPHNMLIEVAGEMGTIGLAFIVGVLLLCIKPILRLRASKGTVGPMAQVIQWVFWIGLTNAMVSFDIGEQRGIFAAIGLLAAVRRWPVEKESPASLPDPTQDLYSASMT